MARPGLTGHRKFRRLVRAIDSVALARGVLELIWDSCYEAGDDYVGTAADIESLVGWTGEAGMLTRALVEAGAPEGHGFLEPASDAVGSGQPGYRVHDLWHHAPDYVQKRRQREIERQQKVDPAKRRRTAPNGGQCPPSPDCSAGVGRTPSPSPSPDRDSFLGTESSHGTNPFASAEPADAGRSTPPIPRGAAERREDGWLTFPTIGPVQAWTLSEAQVAEWASLYAGVDVRQECQKALAWLQASPGRRKTARGMARFLVGWLGRAVDRGGPRGVPVSSTPSWRVDCEARHGVNGCNTFELHELRLEIEKTCRHQPSCRSMGEHRQRERQAQASEVVAR